MKQKKTFSHFGKQRKNSYVIVSWANIAQLIAVIFFVINQINPHLKCDGSCKKKESAKWLLAGRLSEIRRI